MTERSTDTHPNASRARLSIILAMFGIASCSETIGQGPATPEDNDPIVAEDASSGGYGGNNNNGNTGGTGGNGADQDAGVTAVVPPTNNDPVIPTPCAQAPKKAQTALQTYCVGCHGGASAGMGGFKVADDPLALVTTGKVVPNKPEDSPIYKRMSAGTMPPVSVAKRPGDADIQAVKDWISCGAENWNTPTAVTPSFNFVTVDDRLTTMLRDVRSVSNPTDRLRMRYIDLSMLSNAGYSEAQVQVYREATAFLLNSLSTGRNVIAPRAVDRDKLIYRLDLRDYGWDEDTWSQFEAEYPYAVIYDQDSRLFPFDEVSAEQLRRETGTQIPFIQADWFISHGARPPLYHDVLELPDTLQGLEQQLGIDIDRNIADEQVLRAGFKNAGPSQNNRVIERHDLGGNRGALWVSYDFQNNLATRDVFANPLDFTEDGGELIFNLDNGLQAYFVVNNLGVRLDKAPNNVVQDPLARDGAVENGLSCMNCHQEDGQLPKFDEIRDFTLRAGANAAEIEAVIGVYATKAELQDAFDRDQNLYRTARAALGVSKVGATTMHSLDDTHLGLIDINGAAAAVGITADELERALDASAQAFPPEVITLRNPGGAVQRDGFEAVLPELIEALGLGVQLRVNASGAVVNTSNVINTGTRR
jgi:mono/diheme cytochrome c family protein